LQFATIGDAALKIRQTLKKPYDTAHHKPPPPPSFQKICEIQITPTIFLPTLGNNYCLQIIETGFAELF
jgi:hypothetical protein